MRRSRVKRIIIVALAAALLLYGGAPQPSRAQSVDQVAATVRASGLRADLVVVPARVLAGGLVLGVVSVSNVSDQSVLIVRSSLVFNTGALKTLLHTGQAPILLRPHRRTIDVWLMQARRAGTYIVVASITTLNSNLSTSQIESGGELIDIRPH